jgi:hypothetical protein
MDENAMGKSIKVRHQDRDDGRIPEISKRRRSIYYASSDKIQELSLTLSD